MACSLFEDVAVEARLALGKAGADAFVWGLPAGFGSKALQQAYASIFGVAACGEPLP
jgi:hypothetical protein